ncbi:MAG: SpoIIE family protein phosphatase [Clostridia bacterium]|nr:SpoIIE family protein phosphatase [Clostridia bacterium]
MKQAVKTLLTKEKMLCALFAAVALALGAAELAEGVMPFGVALLCAVPKKKRKSVLVGALASALFDDCIPLALFTTLFVFLVLNAKEKNKSTDLTVRYLLAFSASVLRVAYIAVSGIDGINGIFRLLAAAISYPAFTFAFMGFFDKRKELRPRRFDASLLSFAFAATLLLKNLSLSNVPFSLLGGALFTLCAARTRGFAFGGVCGIVCGLVSGGAATGALGVLGMAYGLLANELEPAALVLSFMLAVSGYYYLSGSSGFLESLLMLLLAFALFIPFRSKLSLHRAEASKALTRASDKRLSRYAAAFSSLSSLFYTVSDSTRAETVSDINAGIVKTVESFCNKCKGCSLDKSEISNFLTSEIRQNGVASYSRLPSHISAVCPNSFAIARSVNGLPLLREKEGERGLKLMADEYSAFSSILTDAAKKQEEASANDKTLAEKIKTALLERGIKCDGVRVVGTRLREITVYGVIPDKMSATPNELAELVSAQTKTAVSRPELILHEDYTLMRMKTLPAFRIEYAKLSEAKNGETVCGDTVSVFENDERRFYCLVSDGMGSGRDAALTSRLSAIMLEKLLSVGAEKESALRLLNKALVEKEEEVFATVDLLEIDRVLSTATLIKAGAAPTILIRNGKISILEAKTPPAGIMKNVIADKKTFRIERGDVIVMLSDGILQTGEPFSLLPQANLPPMPNARTLASELLREARRKAEAADDMSVCVLRIV